MMQSTLWIVIMLSQYLGNIIRWKLYIKIRMKNYLLVLG